MTKNILKIILFTYGLMSLDNCASLTQSGQEQWMKNKIFEQVSESFSKRRVLIVAGHLEQSFRITKQISSAEHLKGTRYRLRIENEQAIDNMRGDSVAKLFVSTRGFEAVYIRFAIEKKNDSVIVVKTVIDLDENFSDPVITAYEIVKEATKINTEVRYKEKLDQAHIDIVPSAAENKISARFYRRNFLFQELLAFHYLNLVPLPIQDDGKAIACKSYDKSNICRKLVYTEDKIEKVVVTAE